MHPGADKTGALHADMDFDPHRARDATQLIDAWLPLAFAVDSLNRSMGQPDLYPFVLSPPAIAKLAFIHERIYAARGCPAGESGAGVLKAVIGGLRARVGAPKANR